MMRVKTKQVAAQYTLIPLPLLVHNIGVLPHPHADWGDLYKLVVNHILQAVIQRHVLGSVKRHSAALT